MVESWISILAYCNPVAAHWDREVLKTAKCWPIEVFRIFPLINTGTIIRVDFTLLWVSFAAETSALLPDCSRCSRHPILGNK